MDPELQVVAEAWAGLADDGEINASCGPPVCGNGIVEPGEDCDGVELGSETCVDLGFLSGTLACAVDCQFDTSACVAGGGPGAFCAQSQDCQQGLFCADGTCCTSACNSTCESCALSGSEGTCTLIPAGLDLDNECGGLSCAGFYFGFQGDTCYLRTDASASEVGCNGAGGCQSAEDV